MIRWLSLRMGLGLNRCRFTRLGTLLIAWLLIGLPAQMTLQACISPFLLEQTEEEEAGKSKAEEHSLHATRLASRLRSGPVHRLRTVDEVHTVLAAREVHAATLRTLSHPDLMSRQGAGIALRC